MPDPNRADITLVLDRSGSMGQVRDETIQGHNAFLTEHQKLHGQVTFTLVQFNHHYGPVTGPRAIAEVPPLSQETYHPIGYTALLDALGQTVTEMGQRFEAMPEAERPGKVLLVVLTDGLENASRQWKREQVFAMLTHQRDMYAWQVLFLGANQDAIVQGTWIGVQPQSAMSYAGSPAGTSAVLRTANAASARYLSGQSPTPDFLPEERAEQERLIQAVRQVNS